MRQLGDLNLHINNFWFSIRKATSITNEFIRVHKKNQVSDFFEENDLASSQSFKSQGLVLDPLGAHAAISLEGELGTVGSVSQCWKFTNVSTLKAIYVCLSVYIFFFANFFDEIFHDVS